MDDVSVVALLARLVVSLGVVLGLMWVAARLLARQSAAAGRPQRQAGADPGAGASEPRQEHARWPLCTAAGKALIVGVTDAQVTLLGEGDIDGVIEPDAEEDPATTITAAAGTRSPWALPRDAARLPSRHGRRCSTPSGTGPFASPEPHTIAGRT